MTPAEEVILARIEDKLNRILKLLEPQPPTGQMWFDQEGRCHVGGTMGELLSAGNGVQAKFAETVLPKTEK